MIREVQRARAGDLRDARHADAASRRSELKDAGLDYYNHNLDTSPEFYGEIITTRTYQDRLDTLEAVRDAGMKICCGGIVGMGETARDRAGLLQTLANLPRASGERADQPAGRGAGHAAGRTRRRLDPFDFVRTIAVARILMPQAAGAPVGRPRGR